MRWQKLGRIYAPSGEQDWARSHAYLPTTLMLDEERIRVFVASRDAEQVGRIGYVDVDARDPRRVLEVSADPVLDIGLPGTFDDNGVSPISIVRDGDRVRLYYLGWQLGVRVRYFLFMGLAISMDGGHRFERFERVPVLDRSDRELFVRSAAHVHREGDRWRMWYIAGDAWVEVDGKPVPTYNIRYLESPDGTSWGREGQVCVDLAGDEFGFGRPYVMKADDHYRMWYSIRSRSQGYRLGYAESADGLSWVRKDDQAGLERSETGWDSEMAAFACIQPTRYGTYMFYNGNNYGETGFGAAVLAP